MNFYLGLDAHGLLSWLGIALGIIYSRRKGLEWRLIFDAIAVGLTASVVFGVIDQKIQTGVWQLGERFYGTVLLSNLFLFFRLKSYSNRYYIHSVLLLALSFGAILAKIGCAWSHPNCYGLPTNMPWGISVNHVYRHPMPIYDAVFYLILLTVFLRKDKTKAFVFQWLAIVGLYGFFSDYLRTAHVGFLSLTFAQITYLGVIGLSVTMKIRHRRTLAPQDYRLE